MAIWLCQKVELNTLLSFFLIFDTPTPFLKILFSALAEGPRFYRFFHIETAFLISHLF